MKSKLMLVALVVVVAITGSQAQSGAKTGQPQGRFPTPTAGGTDATSSHAQRTGSSTNKPAMGAGSNTLTEAGSGKKSSSDRTSAKDGQKKAGKTTPKSVNQQAAGVPESGSGSGKRKNR